MLLSAGLIWWSQVLVHVAQKRCDMPGPDPATQLLLTINAPVLFATRFWELWLMYPWNVLAWMAGVGVTWYWVARNIESWRRASRFSTGFFN